MTQDVAGQVEEVILGVYDIDVGCVHNQEGRVGVMKEVFIERLIYAFQILEIDVPFIFSVSLLYPLHQYICRGLEEDGPRLLPFL